MIIENMRIGNVGKVYRSCGNCGGQYARSAEITNIVLEGDVDAVAGVNANFGDEAVLTDIVDDTDGGAGMCQIYEGVTGSGEPSKTSDEPDGESCIVA